MTACVPEENLLRGRWYGSSRVFHRSQTSHLQLSNNSRPVGKAVRGRQCLKMQSTQNLGHCQQTAEDSKASK